MFVDQAEDYYGRIRNMSKDASKQKYPKECLKKAFNVFACSYVFCSSDKRALLMETSEQDCREIGEWYVVDSFSKGYHIEARYNKLHA